MITNREMYCIILGAVISKKINYGDKKQIMIQAGAQFGLTRDETDKMLKELDGTLDFVISRLHNDPLKDLK